MSERKCGRIGMHTISHCADKAAEHVMASTVAVAVCLAPDGHVTVESVPQAIPDEMTGVYNRDLGQFALWALIESDLRVDAVARGIRGGTGHRHRVKTGLRRAA